MELSRFFACLYCELYRFVREQLFCAALPILLIL